MKRFMLFFSPGIILILSSVVWADIPKLINFQGILTDGSGNPLGDTTVSVEFKIYADSIGTNVKWMETDTVTTDHQGRFSITLGVNTPIEDTVFNDTVRYLGVKVETDPELLPRTRLVSVPYANRVSTVDGATGGNISGDVAIQSNLTVSGNIGIGILNPSAKLEIVKDNTKPVLLLTHPDSDDPKWDSEVLAALMIKAPPAPTTRNFVSGLYVQTNAAELDKGRGIFVHNLGKSDGIYVQGDGGGGIAILLTENSPGVVGEVIGTTLNTQTALVLRQETPIKPDAGSESLLKVQAYGSLTEMANFGSSIPNQRGIVCRLTGSGAIPFLIKDALEIDKTILYGNGDAYFAGKLQVGGAFATSLTTTAANLTLADAHSVVLVDASGGVKTISLPAAGGIAGRQYTVKKTDGSANTVSIDAESLDVIDGVGVYNLTAQNKYVTIVSDGENWFVIANN